MLCQRQELGLGAMATALRGHANPLGVQGTCPRKAVGMAPENEAVTRTMAERKSEAQAQNKNRPRSRNRWK